MSEAIPLLLVGTMHFANPGRDLFNLVVDDVLAPQRQQEIEAVVTGLRRFNPTKVAVEWPVDQSERLDAAYSAYRAGEHSLDRGEVEQLGFRLAAAGEHPAIFAVDVMDEFMVEGLELLFGEPPFADLLPEAMRAGEAEIAAEQKLLDSSDIGTFLRELNSPDSVRRTLVPYLHELVPVARGDNYAGPDSVANWYRRNMRIAAHLHALAEQGDRIIVIYGSGHIPVLAHVLGGSPRFELVDPLEFL